MFCTNLQMSYSRGSLRQKHRRWGTCCKITVTIENCFSTDLSLSLGRGKLPQYFKEHFESVFYISMKSVSDLGRNSLAATYSFCQRENDNARDAVRRLLCHFWIGSKSLLTTRKEKRGKEVSCSLRHNFLEHGATQSSKLEIYIQ